jgi:hypothetical protein
MNPRRGLVLDANILMRRCLAQSAALRFNVLVS